MHFDLTAEVLDDETAFVDIDQIVDRIDVHRVTMGIDALDDSRWVHETRPQRRRLMVTSMAGPVRRRGDPGPTLHGKQFVVRDRASAREARKLAVSPLVVMVEDEEADGRFLEIVIDEMGGPLATLWMACKAASPPGVDLRSAAIDLMPARIAEQGRRARGQSRALRLLVLHDSDRRWPGDERGQSDIDAVSDACRRAGAPAPHCLSKRAIENYIPDSTIRALIDDKAHTKRKSALEALLELTPAQRDHFPMKGSGLTDEEADHSLYRDADLTALRGKHALFPKRPRPLVRILDEGHRDTLTAPALSNRDGRAEWETLLQRLADEL